MKKIICISGDLISGKSEAGKGAASYLGYQYFSAGRVFRELAQEKGMKITEFTGLAENDTSIDKAIDLKLAGIGKSREEIVVDARMAWFFIEDSFKVYLQIDIDEAARRIKENPRGDTEKYNSVEEALSALRYRKESEIKRYRNLYGAEIQDLNNQGKAEYQRSLQEAAKIKTIAEAEAEKEARVGIGKAIAVDEQVKAYGGPQYQVVQDIMTKFTNAIEKSKIDIVPKTVVGMGGSGSGSAANAFEMLLGLLISEKLGIKLDTGSGKVEDERVKVIKDTIMKTISENTVETAEQAAPASEDKTE
jgi:predicted cytidylate kinase